MLIKIVPDLEVAIDHIRTHGSLHTEAIVTNDYQAAMRFVQAVDSSSVMVNASTRFADGGEYGMGAEIGISTSKLHAYGPMGLRELTAQKFVVFGQGSIREYWASSRIMTISYAVACSTRSCSRSGSTPSCGTITRKSATGPTPTR